LSGILGLFNCNERPIEAEAWRTMELALAQQGPDGMNSWSAKNVAFSRANLLSNALTGIPECQPAQLGGLVVNADARLDAKHDLRAELLGVGKNAAPGASDSRLILQAYQAWGAGCVEHLRGDFAFLVWDAAAKTLFCARDHFGIKPLYYASLGPVFLVSNSIACLRAHPLVSSGVNERAIGDFLLFGLNYDQFTTSFRDIQRVPPAHTLTVNREGLKLECYWQVPTESSVRFGREQDYIENFLHVLKSATSDRLTASPTGILLSGGLDSSCVAVAAKEISKDQDGKIELRSYTVGYESLIPENEGPQARLVAGHLGIPNRYEALDDVELFEKWEDPGYRFPEPLFDPLSAGFTRHLRNVARECRVVMSGEGADNLLYFQMWPYLEELRRKREWRRALDESLWFLAIRPLPWLGAARRLRSIVRRSSRSAVPPWIEPDFARRVGLEERWRDNVDLRIPKERHHGRPKAHASMLLPQWTHLFETTDPGATHCPVEFRYPFLDLRVVKFLLAIPTFPWAYRKTILRRAMAGQLPDKVRLRKKKPLSIDPVVAKVRKQGQDWCAKRPLEGRVRDFVVPNSIKSFCDTMDAEEMKAWCLDLWLKGIEVP
jgi:asparagine synthase (glutamine-hydrolysing)